MSHAVLARRVDDQTGGGNRLAPLAVSILVGIVAPFIIPMPNGFVFSLLGLIGFGMLWRGTKTAVKTSDPTLAVRVWARPTWWKVISWAMLGLAIVANLFSFIGTSHNYPTVPGTIFWAVLGLVAYFAFTREAGAKAVPGRDWHTIFEASGLIHRSSETGLSVYPTVVGSGTDEFGNEFLDVQIIAGPQTVKTYQNQADRLASAVGVPEVEVVQLDTQNVRLIFVENARAHESKAEWHTVDESLPVVEFVSALPIGVNLKTGEQVHQTLNQRNFVIGGVPGSGKSSFTDSLLANLARHPHVDIAIIDMKEGAEGAKWIPRVSYMVDTTEDALRVVDETVADMKARYARMRAAGVTNAWTYGESDKGLSDSELAIAKEALGDDFVDYLPEPGDPNAGFKGYFLGENEHLKVLIMDECADLFVEGGSKAVSSQRDELINKIGALMRKGRAAGYVVFFITQRPSADAIPRRISSQASERIAFMVGDDTGESSVLKSIDPLNSPQNLTLDTPGRMYRLTDGGRELIQCSYIAPQVLKMLAAKFSPYKRPWTAPGVDLSDTSMEFTETELEQEVVEPDDDWPESEPEPEPEPEPLWRKADPEPPAKRVPTL